MKAVILAGGLGTRLSEETDLRPKPMIEIGGKPIHWHIRKIYSAQGANDFIICAGYKGYSIKEYFANYALHNSDVTFDFAADGGPNVEVHERRGEPWRVTIVDTGEKTQTGGRLKRVQSYVGDEPFCFTYGDGVGNVEQLVAFHRQQGRLATLTAVQPMGRYGALEIDDDARVRQFREKPAGDGSWINGGFFVLEPAALDYMIETIRVFAERRAAAVDEAVRELRSSLGWRARSFQRRAWLITGRDNHALRWNLRDVPPAASTAGEVTTL